MDREKEECMAAGAADYITEPINPDDLLDKVKRLLKQVSRE
jgi:CheY-like chemotaxis protein